MIGIVDYGLGNVNSIKNMLAFIGADSIITNDSKILKKVEKLILPGVGSFDDGMSNLRKLDLISTLTEMVINKKIPTLGICLGMQLMTENSEEGNSIGLKWIDGFCTKFDEKSHSKIPHMGWNTITVCKENALLNRNDINKFYFVHSYHVQCTEDKDILTTTNYEGEFISSFQKGNIFGVQFHPEKSHKYGMQLLKNFYELKEC